MKPRERLWDVLEQLVRQCVVTSLYLSHVAMIFCWCNRLISNSALQRFCTSSSPLTHLDNHHVVQLSSLFPPTEFMFTLIPHFVWNFAMLWCELSATQWIAIIKTIHYVYCGVHLLLGPWIKSWPPPHWNRNMDLYPNLGFKHVRPVAILRAWMGSAQAVLQLQNEEFHFICSTNGKIV